MPNTEIEVNCSHRINDIIAHYPATVAVFNRFGLDTCCGGALSVSDAARAHGLNADLICAELNAAARTGEAAE